MEELYQELTIYPSQTVITNAARCMRCQTTIRMRRGRRKMYCKCHYLYIRSDTDSDDFLIRGWINDGSRDYLELSTYESARIRVPKAIYDFSLEDIHEFAGEIERILADMGAEYEVTSYDPEMFVSIKNDQKIILKVFLMENEEKLQVICSNRVFQKLEIDYLESHTIIESGTLKIFQVSKRQFLNMLKAVSNKNLIEGIPL